jgi:hypothetical protein
MDARSYGKLNEEKTFQAVVISVQENERRVRETVTDLFLGGVWNLVLLNILVILIIFQWPSPEGLPQFTLRMPHTLTWFPPFFYPLFLHDSFQPEVDHNTGIGHIDRSAAAGAHSPTAVLSKECNYQFDLFEYTKFCAGHLIRLALNRNLKRSDKKRTSLNCFIPPLEYFFMCIPGWNSFPVQVHTGEFGKLTP